MWLLWDKSEFSDVQLKDTSIKYILINNYERNQLQYILNLFVKSFFNESSGQLKYNNDITNIKVFGDLSHFNNPSSYPTTIVIPRELFNNRIK